MNTKTTTLLADGSYPMPVGVYAIFGMALLALSLGLAYLNYMSGIAIIDLQRLPDSLKDMRKLQLALVISACILLLVMGALYTPEHFGRVYLTWAVSLAFCLEGYEALVYYQAAQSASQISHSAATSDARRITNLEGQIASEESTANTADALALRNGRSDIVASRQTADAQQANARAARNRAASLRQELNDVSSKQAAPSDDQIFGTWTTTINMLKALLLFLLSVTMSGFAGRNLRFAYAAHLRTAAAAALEEHAKTGKVPAWMARRGLTPAAVALTLGMGAAGAHAAQQPMPSPSAGFTPQPHAALLAQARPKVTITLPAQASPSTPSFAYASKANDQSQPVSKASDPAKTVTDDAKSAESLPESPKKQAKEAVQPELTALKQPSLFDDHSLAYTSKADEQGQRARPAIKAKPRPSTAVPEGEKMDTGTTPGTDSRYQRVKADVQADRIKPSGPAIQKAYGGSTLVARRYLQALERDNVVVAEYSDNGTLKGYKRAGGTA